MPDKSMNIDFRIRGVKRVGEAADNVKRLAKEVKGLQSALGPGNTLALSFGGGRVGGGGGGQAGGGGFGGGGRSGGSNLGKWTAYYGANMRNDPQAAFDFASTMLSSDPFNPGLVSLKNRSQSFMERELEKKRREEENAKRKKEKDDRDAYNKSFAGRFQRWGYSTRFGSTGTMPLVGQSLDLVGLGRLAGPIGAVVAGLGLFKKALDSAVDSARKRQEVYGIGGGTSRDIGRLGILSDLSGVSAADFAARGRAWQDAYYAGGDTGRALRRIGATPPGFGSNRDPNSTPWAIENLRKALAVKDKRERERNLQDLNLGEFSYMGYVPYEKSKNMIGNGMSEETMKKRLGFDASVRWLKRKLFDEWDPFGSMGKEYGEALRTLYGKDSKSPSASNQIVSELKKANETLIRMEGNTRKGYGNAAVRGAIPERWRLDQLIEDAGLRAQMDMGAFEI